MCVHATQATKTIDGYANAFEIGKLNAAIVPNHHIFHMAGAIDQRANLPARFMGQFCQLPRKFRRYDFLWRHTPCVELRNPAQLVRLEARSVSQYVLNDYFLPALRTLLPERLCNYFHAGLRL